MRAFVDALPKMNLPVQPKSARYPHRALHLDSKLDPAKVSDISYSEGADWVAAELERFSLDNTDGARERIDESTRLLGDIRACATWPKAAHSHMQLIHQLKNILNVRHEGDMSTEQANQWAQNEAMKIDHTDAFAIADRMAQAAAKLEDVDACIRWPGSAHAHRQLLSEMSVLLGRLPRVMH